MDIKVKTLTVYPVKSFHGIELKSASLSFSGLPFDRNWMLVDENHTFLTQREHPQMALFIPELLENELIVRHGPDKISIPFHDVGSIIETKVWGQPTRGKEVSGTISKWFSDKMGLPVKLIHNSEKRAVDNAPATEIPFSDSSPFLLIGEGSLTDLNSKMQSSLSMRRFRPNIVVSGIWPYEEDNWKEMQIGNNRFKVWKKCARCKLPNVNPSTGIVDQKVLQFLTTYRKDEVNRINFGVHLYLVEGNEINVDDEVKVLE